VSALPRPVDDCTIEPTAALEMVVRGASLHRTLAAIAGIVSGENPSARCAILLFEDERFTPAAEHNLLPCDRELMRSFQLCSTLKYLNDLARQNGVEVRPLMTQTAELIGALAVFGMGQASNASLNQGLEQVCLLATLAVEQKHLTEELSYQAHHDPLTHLWNRTWMEGEIKRVLMAANQAKTNMGLAAIGLDRLRVINDVLGCQVGNELLRQVARRFLEAIRSRFVLARDGGDEFTVLMPGVSSEAEIAEASEKLLHCFNDVFRIGDHELIVSATIGTAFAEPASLSGPDLQNRAHTALRYAKKRSPGRIAPFHRSMVNIPPERLVMEQHLRFALQKRELELYYQPQIELQTGLLVGMEALLRWNHPALGFISPGTFIPLAEEIGIIEEVGDWVLEEAIAQKEEWNAQHLPRFRVAVNVSAVQFSRNSFANLVAQKIRRARIQPRELELEITESLLMTNFDHGVRQLSLLRSLGVLIAIDDFGTGHSSLAYLQQLPAHRLKIDRMFVREISHKEERPPLLSSIIGMAHALGLGVIAEGVETPEQLGVLSAMNCEEIQGYYFAKPMAARDVPAWIAKAMPGAVLIPNRSEELLLRNC